MQTQRSFDDPAYFLRPSLSQDPGPVSQRLSAQVRAGRLLRFRRDVYLPTATWLEASSRDRYALSVAAVAHGLPQAILCGESALTVWAVPLLDVPSDVTVRATSRGHVGRLPAPRLTGAADEQVIRRLRERTGSSAQARAGDDLIGGLIGHPLRRVSRIRSPSSGSETSSAESVTLPPWTLGICTGPPGGFLLEPLALAVVDVVGRCSSRQAAVILDAVLGGRTRTGARLSYEELHDGIEAQPVRRRRRRAETALSNAAPAAESPGESVTRTVIEELGFPPPVIQSRIQIGHFMYRVDFEWPEIGVVLEFDGRVKYADPQLLRGENPAEVVIREKKREDRIRSTGRIVVRVTWGDVMRPERLEQLLLTAGVRHR